MNSIRTTAVIALLALAGLASAQATKGPDSGGARTAPSRDAPPPQNPR